MLLVYAKLYRVFGFPNWNKKNADSSVKWVTGKTLNDGAEGPSNDWVKGVLGYSVQAQMSLKPPFKNFFPFPWLLTAKYCTDPAHSDTKAEWENLSCYQESQASSPLSQELLPLLIQAHFPAVPPFLHHCFLARSKTMSLSRSSLLILCWTHFLL